MTVLKTTLRATAFGLAMIAAAAAPTKKAHASDGAAVVAGIAGGLILGTIIGSAAQANNGYHSNSYAAVPTYDAPRYYAPPVALSFGYHSGRHFGHRRHYGGHGYFGHRGHRFNRGHRFHRGFRGQVVR